MKLSDQSWQETLTLLQTLIRLHPTYASDGLYQAQSEVANFMQSHHWQSVAIDEFNDDDICGLDGYVNVAAFGPLYQNYGAVQKRNVIGVVDSGQPGPTLILNGHLDVDIVSSPGEWTMQEGWRSGSIIDGRIYGRGSTDMLSGLVAQIAVANFFNEHRGRWCGKIIVTAVTDEEIGGNGTLRSLHWLKSRRYLESETACLIAEPSDGHVCLSSLGFLHLIINFKGSPVHMGVADKEDNAIWEALRFIENFDHLLLNVARSINPGVEEQQVRSNFGIIRGGIDSAIPIPLLELEGTVFFPASLPSGVLGEGLKERICDVSKRAEIQVSEFGFEGADFSPNPLYECIKLVMSSKKTVFPSPCDARFYKKFGVPTVIYGPGYLKEAHSIDEYICLSDLREYIQVIVNGLGEYLKV